MVKITINSGIRAAGTLCCRGSPRQRRGAEVDEERQAMSEERALILEMLKAGRVSVEQADQLLEALASAARSGSHGPATGARTQRRWDERDERADDCLASETPKQLIKMRNHGVSGAFVQEMRATGLGDLNVDDLIALHDHDVT